jgi:hypothetical protein
MKRVKGISGTGNYKPRWLWDKVALKYDHGLEQNDTIVYKFTRPSIDKTIICSNDITICCVDCMKCYSDLLEQY